MGRLENRRRSADLPREPFPSRLSFDTFQKKLFCLLNILVYKLQQVANITEKQLASLYPKVRARRLTLTGDRWITGLTRIIRLLETCTHRIAADISPGTTLEDRTLQKTGLEQPTLGAVKLESGVGGLTCALQPPSRL